MNMLFMNKKFYICFSIIISSLTIPIVQTDFPLIKILTEMKIS